MSVDGDGVHLSSDHFRPVFEGAGPTLGLLGAPEHVRLFTILMTAMRDGCAGCVSDTADALALDPAATAMVHRLGAAVSGLGSMTPWYSQQARATAERLAGLDFALRRSMVLAGAHQLMRTLGYAYPEVDLLLPVASSGFFGGAAAGGAGAEGTSFEPETCPGEYPGFEDASGAVAGGAGEFWVGAFGVPDGTGPG